MVASWLREDRNWAWTAPGKVCCGTKTQGKGKSHRKPHEGPMTVTRQGGRVGLAEALELRALDAPEAKVG